MNLARIHNYALPSKTSVTFLLLFYGLISNLHTCIVYSLDRLLNNLCKNLMDILEIMNYISITVFICLSVFEKEKIMNTDHNFLHHLLTSCAVGRAVDVVSLATELRPVPLSLTCLLKQMGLSDRGISLSWLMCDMSTRC